MELDSVEGVDSPVAVERSVSVSTIGKSQSEQQADDEDILVEYLSKIELTHARFLRATPAHRVIECGGRVLRRHGRGNFAHSRQVEKIGKFISHSWQASPFLKVLTLQMLYNWKPAVFVGNMAAVLAMILFSFDLLPGFQKTPRWGTETGSPNFLGTWSLGFGLLAFLLVWLFWAPREMVFLDQLCINQKDNGEKVKGVANIGACLKHSKEFLLIFDETYCARLWCLFELAAFLTTHADGQILVQPVSLTIFLVVSLLLNSLMWFSSSALSYGSILTLPIIVVGLCLYGWLVATVVLRYRQGLELLKSQLQNFTFEESMCHCCSVNHVNPENPDVPLLCDRAIMRRCVQRWFGSVKEFEELVQTKVKDALTFHMGGQFCPYPVLLATFMPLLWAHMDYASARFLQQETSVGISFLVMGLSALCLSKAVLVALIIICIRDWAPLCPKRFQKLLTIGVSVAYQGLEQIFLQVCLDLFGGEFAVLIFTLVLLVPSVLLWRFANKRG